MDNDNRNGQDGVKNPGEFDAGFDPSFERRNSKAADDLQSAENNASDAEMNNAEDSLTGARETEENAGGLFSGQGKAEKDDKKKGGLKGFFKKKGPMALIIGLIGGTGGLMMGMQTLMPVAIEEMIIEKFNSIGVSSTMASDSWLDTQLNYGVQLAYTPSCDDVSDPDTCEMGNLFGFSDYQVQQFENQGIRVVNVGGGKITRVTALLYKKGNQWIPVVGSDVLKYNGYTQAELVAAIAEASGLSNIGTPIGASAAMADSDFKIPYTTAAKSWRGGSSGWFDDIMSNITETKLSIGRNRWARYAANNIAGMSDAFKKTAASAARAKTGDAVTTAERYIPKEEYDRDGWGMGVEFSPCNRGSDCAASWDATSTGSNTELNGKVMNVTSVREEWYYPEDGGDPVLMGYTVSGNDSASAVNGSTSESALPAALNSKAVKTGMAVAQSISTGINITCGVVEGLMSIYTVVSAFQSLQFLNLISGYLEAVDKVKAGDGDESPIHEYSNNLTADGENKKTGMMSVGMDWLFNNSAIDSNDASVQNVNLETIMSSLSGLTGNIELTAKIFETCGYARVGSAIVGTVTTIISFIPVFGQATSALAVLAQVGIKVAVSLAIQEFFMVAIPKITQKVANSIIKDAATEWLGEDLGNAIISGASKYLGGNGSSGGQGPGTESKVLAYKNMQDIVIAEEAEYQRATRSPFDISSPYTFLGALAYSVVPLAYSGGGVMSAVTKVANTTQNAVVAMLPTANAIDENNDLTSTGECNLLESMGIQGDAFCNPYIITDTATINVSPVAVSKMVHNMHTDTEVAAADVSHYGINEAENFNDDGSIKENSNLAKYITFCGQRTSQYGTKDATIAEQIDKLTNPNATISSIIGVIPVIGDVKSVVDSVVSSGSMQWMTGEACVVGGDYWNENQWYQRYAENERLLENMNPSYKSPVTKFLAQYYEENPVDDSAIGTIARFAGMATEEVEDTMILIAYYMFLDEYDPSVLYAFGAKPIPAELESHTAWRRDEGETAVYYIYNIWWGNTEYADVRNRAVTVV